MTISSSYVEFNLPIGIPFYSGNKTLNGKQYTFKFWWVSYTSCWYMSIEDLRGEVSIRSIALLPGKELLHRYGWADRLGELWVEDTDGSNENPTYLGMGDRWRLRYYPIED